MSHVKAYICDYANHIVKEDDTIAINPIEDIWDKQLSYPSVMKNVDRYRIHYCVECYRDNVLYPASVQIDRSKQEDLYKLKVKELSFNFRSTIVQKWNLRSRPKVTETKAKKPAK